MYDSSNNYPRYLTYYYKQKEKVKQYKKFLINYKIFITRLNKITNNNSIKILINYWKLNMNIDFIPCTKPYNICYDICNNCIII